VLSNRFWRDRALEKMQIPFKALWLTIILDRCARGDKYQIIFGTNLPKSKNDTKRFFKFVYHLLQTEVRDNDVKRW